MKSFVKNFVFLAKILLFEKIYIAKMQRYLWHADDADQTDFPPWNEAGRIFYNIFLIREIRII